jgi:hypothetical protein
VPDFGGSRSPQMLTSPVAAPGFDRSESDGGRPPSDHANPLPRSPLGYGQRWRATMHSIEQCCRSGLRDDADGAVPFKDRPTNVTDRGHLLLARCFLDVSADEALAAQVGLDHVSVVDQDDRLTCSDLA